jgi:hypothetical protein
VPVHVLRHPQALRCSGRRPPQRLRALRASRAMHSLVLMFDAWIIGVSALR